MSITDAARDAFDRLLLLDECTITREGDQVFDPETGEYTVPSITVASELACNLTPFTGAGILSEAFGGEAVNTRSYRLTVRYDAPEIKKEDRVEMTSSEDSGLVGRVFRVEHAEGETFQSARRLVVESIDVSEA